MRRVLLSTLVFAAVLPAWAAPIPPQRAVSGPDYFPLKKGTRWVYKQGEAEVTVAVAGTERFDGEECVLVETSVGRAVVTSELYAVRRDGVYRVRVKDQAVTPPVKVLAFPIKVDGSWPVESEIGGQGVKGRMAVKDDRAKVKTPAGEFECVVVESADLTVAGAETKMRFWFAKGRGIVKQEFTLKGVDPITLELEKFEQGEAAPPPRGRPEPR
jgi:hypothetical protein